jgi:putative transposase
MGGTLTNLLYHIVFSTKLRQPLLSSEIRTELYPYIGGVIRGEKGRLIKIGGTQDHIHLLVLFPPSISVSDMLRRIKANSSKWVNDQQKMHLQFSWQRGYGAFSVSESAVNKLSAYIDRQETHHKRMSFQDEFLLLLKKHNVPHDERYIWD